jgi:hypothetical protein
MFFAILRMRLKIVVTAVLYKYKIEVGSCRLLIAGFCSSLYNHSIHWSSIRTWSLTPVYNVTQHSLYLTHLWYRCTAWHSTQSSLDTPVIPVYSVTQHSLHLTHLWYRCTAWHSTVFTWHTCDTGVQRDTAQSTLDTPVIPVYGVTQHTVYTRHNWTDANRSGYALHHHASSNNATLLSLF